MSTWHPHKIFFTIPLCEAKDHLGETNPDDEHEGAVELDSQLKEIFPDEAQEID